VVVVAILLQDAKKTDLLITELAQKLRKGRTNGSPFSYFMRYQSLNSCKEMAQPPAYNKPERPGIWMSFDNSVGIYHIIQQNDTFEQAAQDLFNLIKDAQNRFPEWPRVLYLDINGHLDEQGRFTQDFVELQQEYMFATLAPFLTALETPMVEGYNPQPQRNDLPDRLRINT
jgi:hypothetical protein